MFHKVVLKFLLYSSYVYLSKKKNYYSVRTTMLLLQSLREELYKLHKELPANDLVKWTGGNVSARDPETGYIVIKPSGVRYEDLKPEHMVIVNLDGNIIEGDLKPSSDTASHLYIYRQRPDVGGIVHTHSPYATAFAAVGKRGPIPCGDFALIGSEAIGKVVVESIGSSCAVLLKNHGVFTIGKNATAAVKAAVMTEDVAKTVWLALQIGQPEEIAPDDVAKLHHRYTHVYGQ